MTTFGIRIGESFVGDGPDAAHVNIVIGHRDVLGAAFAQALASPRPGHTPFVVVLRPGLPVKPLTLFTNKATIVDDDHGGLTWGAAQAGVALGVVDAVTNGDIPAKLADDLLVIAAVWVNPQASNADAVCRNNRESTVNAIGAAVRGLPKAADVFAASADCHNPFYDARPLLGSAS